jgi:undecaprenyl-diphosphatase
LETELLLALHAQARPWLDQAFLLSHRLGTSWFMVPLVLGTALRHYLRQERRLASMWLGLGLSTLVLLEGLKHLVDRPRPHLWPRLSTWPPLPGPDLLSFPSGHALASVTLYPLLAYVLTRRATSSVRAAAVTLGVLMAVWIGVGRLYLGVHWPTDVMAGFALGAVQAGVALRWLRRADTTPLAP